MYPWRSLIILMICTGSLAVAEQPTTLRLVSYNIKHGRGMDEKVDLERVADVIRPLRPDLVALQEIDVGCTRSGQVDIAAELGRMLKMDHRFARFMDIQGGEYGLAVLSRLPIWKSHSHPLPAGAEPRSALEIVVQPSGSSLPLSFVSVHHDWTQEELRVVQVKALIEALSTRRHPIILAGDFNAQRGAASLQLLEEAGWTLDDKGDAMTFPADEPNVEIDFFMVRGFPGVDGVTTTVHDETMASDHRPISTEISLLPVKDP